MKNTLIILILATFCLALQGKAAAESSQRQFTFAWPFVEGGKMAPRGGTTKGAKVTLAKEPSKAWKALAKKGISGLERDRRAILAMAGPYRTSFDFIETEGYTPGYTPSRPYQSWGTEFLYVLEDQERFISLQHILVMVMELEDGSTSAPIVVKHWRQDWRYEDRDLHVFAGQNRWQRQILSTQEAKGTWTQAVFQVDDSPRYESYGRWVHYANYSSWQSEDTWRPLPRREFSVRSDYQVLAGTNRHTITPTGWVQGEENLKVVLDAHGNLSLGTPVLAREIGLNRYQLITGHDFSAGDSYWHRTSDFWRDVRTAWAGVYRIYDAFRVREKVGGKSLIEAMFEYAEKIEAAAYDHEKGRNFIQKTLAGFVEPYKPVNKVNAGTPESLRGYRGDTETAVSGLDFHSRNAY